MRSVCFHLPLIIHVWLLRHKSFAPRPPEYVNKETKMLSHRQRGFGQNFRGSFWARNNEFMVTETYWHNTGTDYCLKHSHTHSPSAAFLSSGATFFSPSLPGGAYVT